MSFRNVVSRLAAAGLLWLLAFVTVGFTTVSAQNTDKGLISSGAAPDFSLQRAAKTDREYGVTAVPTVVMIDPDGMIVYAGAFDEPSAGNKARDRKPEDGSFYKAASRLLLRRQVTSPAPSPEGCALRSSGALGATNPGE